MRARWWLVGAAAAVSVAVFPLTAAAGTGDTVPPDTSTPDTSPPITIAPRDPLAGLVSAAPLVPVPEGCAVPPTAAVVFVGRLVATDARTGRFRIEHIRAGTADPFRVGGLVDVRYGKDVDLLRVDEEYLVGAAVDPATQQLASKVRATEPLLGGNAIIGLTEKAGDCPRLEDPVRTFHPDGSEIEAGVLQGLSSDTRNIALAFVKPVVAALAIVLGLVLVRWLITAYALGIRKISENPEFGRSHRE